MENNQERNKKILNLKIYLGLFILIGMLGGVTYAFFNYTRTGDVNTVRLGNISFSTTQNGQINLTNAFPIDSSTINNTPLDEDNIGVVSVTITGSTTYSDGVEYVISVDNFNNTTLNNKKVPVAIDTTVAGRNSKTLGTSTSTYFNENVRENSSVAIYKKTDYTYVFEDEQLLVGYIPQNAEVDGTLTIKAYIDKDKVAISDTYDGTESNNMGTTTNWVNGRTVFTTQEWNNLQENGISFNIKVEANEGIWVEEVNSINTMNTFPAVITDHKADIKEVYFNKMTPTQMNTSYTNATIKADLTYNNEGKVLAWLETNTTDNTKYNLIVASDGDTYLTTGRSMFSNWNNTNKIEFGNIDTSRVTDMYSMFYKTKITQIDISTFNTSRVTTMSSMFAYTLLTDIDLSNKGSAVLSDTSNMFQNSSIENIIFSEFNFGNVDSNRFNGTFNYTSNLTTLDLSNAKALEITQIGNSFSRSKNFEEISLQNFIAPKLTDMSGAFRDLNLLRTINLNGLQTGNITTVSSIFNGCSSLEEIDLSWLNTSYLATTGGAYGMFVGCSSLEKVYVDSIKWNISNQPDSMPIFESNTNLVGQAPNGTTYAFTDYNTTDKTYAKVATNDTVGYLTDISLKTTT